MRPALIAALVLQVTTPSAELSNQRIAEAIELGRTGKVPVLQVGTFLGISKGDSNVFIDGPIGRIAAAAQRAFNEFRPFDAQASPLR